MNKDEKVGAMRERITIQAVTETQSGTGYPAESWGTYATRWAAVNVPNIAASKEDEESGQKTATRKTTFTIRYDANVTEKHRVTYRNNTYDIVAVIHNADRRYTELETQLKK
jgi:SPP1 family predicted phage head-tail adaptor